MVGKIVNGEVDVAAFPINLAMVLYNHRRKSAIGSCEAH